MKATTQIPYITLPDLNEVLLHCTDAGYISDQSRHRVIESATERTQELIRKSKEATAVNLMRDRCKREAKNLYHEQKSLIARQRAMQYQLYDSLRKSAESEHQENIALIKADYHRLQRQCQEKIDETRIRMVTLPEGTEERQKAVASVRVLENRQRELKRRKEEDYAAEHSRHRQKCDRLKAEHFRRLTDLSLQAKDHLLQHEETLNIILGAKPEQLATIYDELHSRLLTLAATQNV